MKLSNLEEKFNDFLSKYNKVNSELQLCKKFNSHLQNAMLWQISNIVEKRQQS